MGSADTEMNVGRWKPEALWYVRHEAALKRWPVLTEPWAVRLEARLAEENAPKDIAFLHGSGR